MRESRNGAGPVWLPNKTAAGETLSTGAAEGYLVYYRLVARGGIEVLRVIHGKREQKRAWKERRE